ERHHVPLIPTHEGQRNVGFEFLHSFVAGVSVGLEGIVPDVAGALVVHDFHGRFRVHSPKVLIFLENGAEHLNWATPLILLN
ncbi:MAG: hypothetical protein MK160_14585, partial [Rhodobacteraceae bacterium]|nr:hypothetical protein [Paracoccaceae bacterium]